jgi:diguanylate cyclase (GGDEF)-like protein
MESAKKDPQEKSSTLQLLLSRVLTAAVSILVLVLIFGTLAVLNADKVVEQLELKTYDLRAQIQWDSTNKRPSPAVVILQFDDASLNTLSDEFGVWPWPRDVHARMIDFLNQIGVRSLLYDIMFVSPRKGNEAADAMLADAFKRYNNVYLSMNLTDDLLQSRLMGKDLTPRDIELLKPLTIELHSDLANAPANSSLLLQRDEDGSVFFKNNHMTFNYYRSIMPNLLNKGGNIGIINHGSDDDGVSRSNPLFFRFKYFGFIKTKALPLHPDKGHWLDAQNNRVDAAGYLLQKTSYFPLTPKPNGIYQDNDPKEPRLTDADGYLVDDYGHPVYQREKSNTTLYFPYLGLRAALDLKYPHQKLSLLLSKDGHLHVKDYDIPLSNNGDFLVNWYNISLSLEDVSKAKADLLSDLSKINAQQKKLEEGLNQPTGHKKDRPKMLQTVQENKVVLKKVQTVLQQVEQREQELKSNYIPQPYRRISAWQVIRLMKKQEHGTPFNDDDKRLIEQLKNKIIFVGATAVATYDIKNTSIHSTMPGVILQANVFDNLLQNTGHYLQRVPPSVNLTITLILCLMAAGCTLRMRSALAGLLITSNVAIIYALFTIIAFQTFNLWINIAMPLVCLIITTTITFMLKYFISNKDYEKTYALATTDSMTNLYNHRFFQDQMRHSIEQCNRSKSKFSLLLIDIDFFKKFNDSYGHQAGDEVLRQVARKLQKNVRTVDIVARYGGEEMTIILDRANEEEALLVAQKIVRAIADEAYPIAEGIAKHVTISCGVSTYPTHGESPSQLIEFADAGLYRAKSNGRNQVGPQYDDPNAPKKEEEEPQGH